MTREKHSVTRGPTFKKHRDYPRNLWQNAKHDGIALKVVKKFKKFSDQNLNLDIGLKMARLNISQNSLKSDRSLNLDFDYFWGRGQGPKNPL